MEVHQLVCARTARVGMKRKTSRSRFFAIGVRERQYEAIRVSRGHLTVYYKNRVLCGEIGLVRFLVVCSLYKNQS